MSTKILEKKSEFSTDSCFSNSFFAIIFEIKHFLDTNSFNSSLLDKLFFQHRFGRLDTFVRTVKMSRTTLKAVESSTQSNTQRA